MQSTTYKQYLLTVLMVVYTLNFMERAALGLGLSDMKIELDLSDTQLGVVTGIASAFFYAVMGIPIARWADRGNRVAIIAIMAALQCVAVALLGLAGSFLQLLLIRIAVSVGEAGCVPPAHSLIADYFPRGERPRAVARYKLGSPLALSAGYFAAGWLNALYGWRATFVYISLPGLVLAALAWFTLREPRLLPSTRAPASLPSEQPSFREVLGTLWANAAFRHLLVAFSVWYFFAFGINQWQPMFFVRSHGMKSRELGMWFAVIFGFGAGLGTYLGGELAARYAAENERRQLTICALAFTVLPMILACTFIVGNQYLALGILGLSNLGLSMTLGPIFGSVQTLVPARMRATSIALVYLFANLIGMGLGPLAVGSLSDGLFPVFGKESLRCALVIMCPGFLWAAWHLWLAGRTVAGDIAATQVADSSHAYRKRLSTEGESRTAATIRP